MAKNCDQVAEVLKALAHPQRLMILCYLSQGERTVSELEELCGASQSAVSQFLGRMKLEGLVTASKSGLNVFYSIKDKRVKQLIVALHKVFCG